ncbi:hypothetical protein CANARDRAFT_9966 [[Candida] arabinofermentans NRRL YB-2248]|uniref:non-specific serine/threonine protein kinase n=1 Tax=[Candida] arabinofermentans NRRL YB-2248 TaxID=983967 RepID=A0A1E4SU12_9ASCO|nr:hypothetical protein CANARDRAFT_9966 [[Candida] arabinofermentans NRRL YB-2248]
MQKYNYLSSQSTLNDNDIPPDYKIPSLIDVPYFDLRLLCSIDNEEQVPLINFVEIVRQSDAESETSTVDSNMISIKRRHEYNNGRRRYYGNTPKNEEKEEEDDDDGTLFDVVKSWESNGTSIPLSEKLPLIKKYILNICEGLNYMHGMGLFHGDIKLENCLVDIENNHKILLCDFGMANFYKIDLDSTVKFSSLSRRVLEEKPIETEVSSEITTKMVPPSISLNEPTFSQSSLSKFNVSGGSSNSSPIFAKQYRSYSLNNYSAGAGFIGGSNNRRQYNRSSSNGSPFSSRAPSYQSLTQSPIQSSYVTAPNQQQQLQQQQQQQQQRHTQQD